METVEEDYINFAQVREISKPANLIKEKMESILFESHFEKIKSQLQKVFKSTLSNDQAKEKISSIIIRKIQLINFETFKKDLEAMMKDFCKKVEMINHAFVVGPEKLIDTLKKAIPELNDQTISDLLQIILKFQENRLLIISDELSDFRFEDSESTIENFLQNFSMEDSVFVNYYQQNFSLETCKDHLAYVPARSNLAAYTPLALLAVQINLNSLVTFRRELSRVSELIFNRFDFQSAFSAEEVQEKQQEIKNLVDDIYLKIFIENNRVHVDPIEFLIDALVNEAVIKTQPFAQEVLSIKKDSIDSSVNFVMFKKLFQNVVYFFSQTVDDLFKRFIGEGDLMKFPLILSKTKKAYDLLVQDIFTQFRDFFDNSDYLSGLSLKIRKACDERRGKALTYSYFRALSSESQGAIAKVLLRFRFSEFSPSVELDKKFFSQEEHLSFLQELCGVLRNSSEKELAESLASALVSGNLVQVNSILKELENLGKGIVTLDLGESEFLGLLVDLYVLHFNFGTFFLGQSKKSNFSPIKRSFPKLRQGFFALASKLGNGQFAFMNFQVILELEQAIWAQHCAFGGKEGLEPRERAGVEAALNRLGAKAKLGVTSLSDVRSLSCVVSISGFLSEDSDKSTEWADVGRHQQGVDLHAINWSAESKDSVGKFLSEKGAKATEEWGKAGSNWGKALIGVKFLVQAYAANPFTRAFDNAKETGEVLAAMIRKERLFGGRALSFVCFSLGTVLGLETLLGLRAGVEEQEFVVQDVVLAGSCADLEFFQSALPLLIGPKGIVSGRIFVICSKNDSVLKYIFKAARPTESALGYWGLSFSQAAQILHEKDPILSQLPMNEVLKYTSTKYSCIDTTHYIDGHSYYRGNFQKILEAINFNVDFSDFFQLPVPFFFPKNE